jgi:hypothetical protein
MVSARKAMSTPKQPRDVIALNIPDLSAFAKTLRSGLEQPPGHVETLNLIARAAGYRNYQHLKARQIQEEQPIANDRQVARALRFFKAGKFAEWPAKTQVQKLCLWALWAQLPAQTDLHEREISTLIHSMCLFKDAAQIRRAMVEHQMVARAKDGSCYQRIEQALPAEALAVIAQVKKTL